MSNSTLVIGDTHIEANEDLDRFKILGKFIIHKQPSTIILLGDFLSLDSLSAWDLNKRAKMEGRRFSAELSTGREAVELMMQPLAKLRNLQRIQKRKIYSPRLIYILGNHEDRWYRYLDTHPELMGVVDLYKDLGFKKYKWELIPYREYAYVDGVCFTHAIMNGVNQPASGLSLMNNAAKNHEQSVIFGHVHKLAIASDTRQGEKPTQILSICAGCYFENTPEYARGSSSARDWWRGLLLLNNHKNGQFDIETFSLERLKEEFL